METLFVIIIGSIVLLAVGITLLGMTLQDLRTIYIELQLQQHPRSLSRARPLVSVFIEGDPLDECIESIWNSDYQKIEVIAPNCPAHGKLYLTLRRDAILDKTVIKNAVHTFQLNERLGALELLPVFARPQTLRQLFHLHRLIAASPFVSSRAGLGVMFPHDQWPTMTRPNWRRNWRTYMYVIMKWPAQVAVFIALFYAIYLDVFWSQPILFILCLIAFGLWMTIAIAHYPYLTIRQRIIYLLLVPVSMGYFIVLGMLAIAYPILSLFKKSVTHSPIPIIR